MEKRAFLENGPNLRELARLLLPAGGICIALALHLLLPTVYPSFYVAQVYPKVLGVCLAIALAAAVASVFLPALRKRMVHYAPLIFAVFLLVELLDILTLKTGVFVLPFMPSPDKVLGAYGENYRELAKNFTDSFVRLLIGLGIGGVAGFISGLLMGWSQVWNYWLSPVLKLLGPLPAVGWIPIAVSLMPSNQIAGIFLISVAMWFPVTLMFSSGIKAVPRKQVESARVLGASEGYILFHVALPGATNSIFTGIFMGLSNSFSALLVAETLGVKAGLGWYINWAASWSDYGLVFAIIGIFIVMFFVLIQLCFMVRDRVMTWQKGIVRW